MLPWASPAAQTDPDGSHETDSRLSVWLSTEFAVHFALAAEGFVEASALPLASTATHSEIDAQDTPAGVLVCVWGLKSNGVGADQFGRGIVVADAAAADGIASESTRALIASHSLGLNSASRS